MIRSPLIRLVLAAAVLAIAMQPRAVAGTADTEIGRQIKTLIDDYENSVRAQIQKMVAAPSEAEKAAIRATMPRADSIAPKVFDLVEKNPQDAGVARGLVWLVMQAAGFPEGQKALNLLGTTHATLAGTGEAVQHLAQYPLNLAEPVLNTIREKNPHKEEQAAATMALATQWFRIWDGTSPSPEADQAREKASGFYQEVLSQFQDVSINGFPLADQATHMLFEIENLAAGKTAPEIEGKDSAGQSFKLSDYRGQAVLLVFWGSWCHACHGVTPKINEIAAQFAGKPVVVLGVNTDTPETLPAVLKERQITWRNWSDETTSGPISTLWNIRNWPTIYVIDAKGVIIAKNPSLEMAVQKLDEAAKAPQP